MASPGPIAASAVAHLWAVWRPAPCRAVPNVQPPAPPSLPPAAPTQIIHPAEIAEPARLAGPLDERREYAALARRFAEVLERQNEVERTASLAGARAAYGHAARLWGRRAIIVNQWA
ncbi:hypothetical protein J4558_17355 [Leptolyngbya sp. 15MV]|nr:hypothetical protein J4558_17355 [Leptolyngbya sp. 15MV]